MRAAPWVIGAQRITLQFDVAKHQTDESRRKKIYQKFKKKKTVTTPITEKEKQTVKRGHHFGVITRSVTST